MFKLTNAPALLFCLPFFSANAAEQVKHPSQSPASGRQCPIPGIANAELVKRYNMLLLTQRRTMVRKIVLITVVTFAMQHIDLWAANISLQKICNSVAGQNGNAVLLQDGKVAKGIKLGEFDFSNKRKSGDFIPSTGKFILIVGPRDFVLEESCSLSKCVDKKEIRPRCRNSHEYKVTFRFNPRKFRPGNFESDIDFDLTNKKEQLPVDERFKFHFNKKAIGMFRMSFAEIVEDVDTSNKIVQLFEVGKDPVRLELINRGNSHLNIGTWSTPDDEIPPLTLNSSACQSTSIPPGGRCNLVLENSSKTSIPLTHMTWHNHFNNEVQNISLILSPRSDGTVNYSIRND
jgi:hypothetical protein